MSVIPLYCDRTRFSKPFSRPRKTVKICRFNKDGRFHSVTWAGLDGDGDRIGVVDKPGISYGRYTDDPLYGRYFTPNGLEK